MTKKFNTYINIEMEDTETGDCLPAGNGEVTLAAFDEENDAECLVDRIIAFSNDQIEGNAHISPKLISRQSDTGLVEAVDKYGLKHLPSCDMKWEYHDNLKCTCGRDEALAKYRSKE